MTISSKNPMLSRYWLTMADLAAPWVPDSTMEPLWERGNKARQICAAGGAPISDQSLLVTYHTLLTDSGLFYLPMRDWNKRPAATKTLANFITHFNEANVERLTYMKSDNLGKSNLARAFGAFQSLPGSSPPAVPGAIQRTTNVSPELQQALGAVRNATPASTKELIVATAPSAVPVEVFFAYCWSHGLTRNPEHTSLSCKQKRNGHQDDATLITPKGGNMMMQRPTGDRDSYRALNPPQPRNKDEGSTTKKKKKKSPKNSANHAAAEDSGSDSE